MILYSRDVHGPPLALERRDEPCVVEPAARDSLLATWCRSVRLGALARLADVRARRTAGRAVVLVDVVASAATRAAGAVVERTFFAVVAGQLRVVTPVEGHAHVSSTGVVVCGALLCANTNTRTGEGAGIHKCTLIAVIAGSVEDRGGFTGTGRGDAGVDGANVAVVADHAVRRFAGAGNAGILQCAFVAVVAGSKMIRMSAPSRRVARIVSAGAFVVADERCDGLCAACRGFTGEDTVADVAVVADERCSGLAASDRVTGLLAAALVVVIANERRPRLTT